MLRFIVEIAAQDIIKVKIWAGIIFTLSSAFSLAFCSACVVVHSFWSKSIISLPEEIWAWVMGEQHTQTLWPQMSSYSALLSQDKPSSVPSRPWSLLPCPGGPISCPSQAPLRCTWHSHLWHLKHFGLTPTPTHNSDLYVSESLGLPSEKTLEWVSWPIHGRGTALSTAGRSCVVPSSGISVLCSLQRQQWERNLNCLEKKLQTLSSLNWWLRWHLNALSGLRDLFLHTTLPSFTHFRFYFLVHGWFFCTVTQNHRAVYVIAG